MNEQTPDDVRKAAEESLELARVLVGQVQISDREFLERMARSDGLVGDDWQTDGLSCKVYIEAQVAREMLEAGEYEDVRRKWSDEVWRRWKDSKFFKLWQEAKQAGRDPEKEFEDRGWSP